MSALDWPFDEPATRCRCGRRLVRAWCIVHGDYRGAAGPGSSRPNSAPRSRTRICTKVQMRDHRGVGESLRERVKVSRLRAPYDPNTRQGRAWTEEESALLRELWPTRMTQVEIAVRLERTANSVVPREDSRAGPQAVRHGGAGVSYADYLATVRVQSQRDRDRFLGIESHEDQPKYSAETGDRVLDVATLRSYAAFRQAMANFGGVVTRAYEGYRDLYLRCLLRSQRLRINSFTAPVMNRSASSRPPAPRELGYPNRVGTATPKPKREWWNR